MKVIKDPSLKGPTAFIGISLEEGSALLEVPKAEYDRIARLRGESVPENSSARGIDKAQALRLATDPAGEYNRWRKSGATAPFLDTSATIRALVREVTGLERVEQAADAVNKMLFDSTRKFPQCGTEHVALNRALALRNEPAADEKEHER